MRLRRLESAPVCGHLLVDEAGCGEEFDSFWSQVRDGYGSCLQRDARFLQWRLFDAATHPLTLSALRDAQGRLKAWAVWGRQEYSRDVSAAVLRDVLCPAGDRETFGLLLSLLLRRWRRAGSTWASLEVAMPWISDVFRSSGCEHVPSRGNRYHVHLASAVDPAVLGNWYRGALDGDYFDY
ncbi:hypothetical protein [Rubrivivax gelatinosus]|uniref:Uncharacterized protein n=1 Tax=Rubrivivax gelatinosus (strain NBRC 100245 / IL144) TaxID=983917 RepID=I0HL84_RUBGI|nr:hypothetical protein [Rubrivivax gelatinosus]BAL93771.1 hypothetical protein RGE_04260 [Rubrivivax gelatinosus IL144]